MFLILAGRLIRNHFFFVSFFLLLLFQRTCPGRGHMAYVQYVNVTAFHIHKLKSTSLQLDRFLCPALVAFPRLASLTQLALPAAVPYFPSFPTFCFTIRFAALLVPFFQHAHIHTRMYLTYTYTHTHSHTATLAHTRHSELLLCSLFAVCCLTCIDYINENPAGAEECRRAAGGDGMGWEG